MGVECTFRRNARHRRVIFSDGAAAMPGLVALRRGLVAENPRSPRHRWGRFDFRRVAVVPPERDPNPSGHQHALDQSRNLVNAPTG